MAKYNTKFWTYPPGPINARRDAIQLTDEEKRKFTYWLDKKVPYITRSIVPEEFRHEDQLYDDEM